MEACCKAPKHKLNEEQKEKAHKRAKYNRQKKKEVFMTIEQIKKHFKVIKRKMGEVEARILALEQECTGQQEELKEKENLLSTCKAK